MVLHPLLIMAEPVFQIIPLFFPCIEPFVFYFPSSTVSVPFLPVILRSVTYRNFFFSSSLSYSITLILSPRCCPFFRACEEKSFGLTLLTRNSTEKGRFLLIIIFAHQSCLLFHEFFYFFFLFCSFHPRQSFLLSWLVLSIGSVCFSDSSPVHLSHCFAGMRSSSCTLFCRCCSIALRCSSGRFSFGWR